MVVNIPGKGQATFPDNMTPDQVTAAIQKTWPDLAPKKSQDRSQAPTPEQEAVQGENFAGRTAEAITNIPKDTAEVLKNIYNAIRHPMEVAKGLTNIAVGGAEKVVPGQQDKEVNFDAFAKSIYDSYGTWDNFSDSLVKAPVQTFMDLSGLFAGSSAVMKAGKIKGSGAVRKAGRQLEPFTTVAEKGVDMSKSMIKEHPENWMKQVLKIEPDAPQYHVDRVVDTALREGYIPTRESLDRLKSEITDTTRKMDEIVDKIPPGASVDIDVMLQPLQDAMQKAQKSGYKGEHMAELNKLYDNYMNQPQFNTVTLPNGQVTRRIPMKDAVQLKKQIHADLEAVMQKQGSLSEEALKGVSRQINDATHAMFPELKGLGQKNKELIDLQNYINARINNLSQKDLAAAGTLGYAVGGGKGAIAAFILRSLLRADVYKAKLARAMYNARVTPTNIKGKKLTPRLSIDYVDSVVTTYLASEAEQRQQPSEEPMLGAGK